MEDSQIIDLYWARLEQAIQETDTKYGGYCRAIAHNILKSMEDSEECVSDTWLRAWNAMPPQRPSVLSAFLGRITRNLSLDRYKAARAEKRGGSSFPAALDELSECVPAGGSVEQTMDERELGQAIDRFLRTIPEKQCSLFLRLQHAHRHVQIDRLPHRLRRNLQPVAGNERAQRQNDRDVNDVCAQNVAD